MNKKELSFLAETFLLANLSENDISLLPCDVLCETYTYARGEHADPDLQNEKRIGFILSGECAVMREGLVMNILKKGDSFGILSVFSNEAYPTAVIAKKETKILFLGHDDLIRLIDSSPRIAMNVITFLAGRVTFLNAKVATLCKATVEDKCIAYLKEEYKIHGAAVPFPISKIARKISAGRASLYRALNTLKEKGLIEYTDNTVMILCPDLIKN